MIRENILALINEARLNFRFAFRKLGIPGYSIHQVYLPKKQLIYIPIPKNACSSIKHALYEIEFGRPFDYDLHEKWGYRDIHNYYKKRPNAFTGKTALEAQRQASIFTLVRDPVKRLISCYRNRVVDLGDLAKSEKKLKRRGLPLKPDLNTFILNLENYREANKIIEHHSRPQQEFLGNSLSYFDHVFTLNNMDELVEMLQGYKQDLEMRREKSGGSAFSLKDLSPEALEKAISFYDQDYELLDAYYSSQKIKREYEELHSGQ